MKKKDDGICFIDFVLVFFFFFCELGSKLIMLYISPSLFLFFLFGTRALDSFFWFVPES